eukprot:TRINITY_DN40582_c0_g1_i1.p1 TRINITY_DN40582_c0_g1~~TRINITY_DN40582_c0_g1_i1.p1  ORF type:complete len:198 (-),score=46.01 TRINITY_DN40582_c0_g1_i1:161-754(-)
MARDHALSAMLALAAVLSVEAGSVAAGVHGASSAVAQSLDAHAEPRRHLMRQPEHLDAQRHAMAIDASGRAASDIAETNAASAGAHGGKDAGIAAAPPAAPEAIEAHVAPAKTLSATGGSGHATSARSDRAVEKDKLALVDDADFASAATATEVEGDPFGFKNHKQATTYVCIGGVFLGAILCCVAGCEKKRNTHGL